MNIDRIDNEAAPMHSYAKPERMGLYRRQTHGYRWHWSMWTGTQWLRCCATKSRAAMQVDASSYQNLPWYGITKESHDNLCSSP